MMQSCGLVEEIYIKKARFQRFNIMKPKKFKRLRSDNPTFNNTPTNLRIPHSELSLSRLPHTNNNMMPHTQPSRSKHEPHTQPKALGINQMATNLLSKFSGVATTPGPENQVPTIQRRIQNQPLYHANVQQVDYNTRHDPAL